MKTINIVYLIYIAIISLGFYGVISSQNLVKKIISLNIIQTAIILLYVANGYRFNSLPPVLQDGAKIYSSPVPHVLMLTAIVVGISVSAIALSLVLRIKKEFNTIQDSEIEQKIHQAQHEDNI